MTTVYISLKRLNNADNEWHTGLLHTGVFDQLGSGSRSKGEVSIHLSRMAVKSELAIVGLVVMWIDPRPGSGTCPLWQDPENVSVD